MVIRNFIRVLVLLIVLTFLACKENSKQNEQVKNDSIVSEIKIDSSKQYKELIKVFKDHQYDILEDLWSYKDFIYFYENSDYYVNEAISILDNKSTNVTQRKVIIYNMQRLSLENYMNLYESLYVLYREKVIDKETFLIAIYPTFGKQNTIIKNYRNDLVKVKIKELILDMTLKEYHNSFKEILSGKSWKKKKEFLNNNS